VVQGKKFRRQVLGVSAYQLVPIALMWRYFTQVAEGIGRRRRCEGHRPLLHTESICGNNNEVDVNRLLALN
jgi:hypothetical protein